MRRIIPLIITISLALTGCWDRREVNDIAFVVGSSIDKEKGKYRLSVQIALPGQLGGAGSQGGGGGTSGSKPWQLESMLGSTLSEANQNQQKSLSRTLYYAHRRTLLIGEEMAKEGIEPIMDVVGRITQNRLTAYVVVTKGPAYKILQADAPIEKFPSEMVRELAVGYMRNARTIKHLLNLMLSDGIDPALPVATVVSSGARSGKKENTNIRLSSLAVFHRDKLTGYLEEDETQGVLWAMNEINRPQISIPAPKGVGKIVVEFQETNTEITPQIEGDEITMQFEVRGKGSIVENDSTYELANLEQIRSLEHAIGMKVKKDIESGIRALQNKYHSDAIGFGKIIYNQRPNDWKRFRKNWDQFFPTVKIKVAAKLHLEHTGAIIVPFGRKDKNTIR